jgi:hypothetical protein
MAESGRAVKIFLNNGETRSYENARVDIDKEGWITIYSLKQVPEHAGEVVAEYNRLEVALHKKSGQKSDSVVNKDFLVSF